MAFGDYPAEYNPKVHGPYDPARFYGKGKLISVFSATVCFSSKFNGHYITVVITPDIKFQYSTSHLLLWCGFYKKHSDLSILVKTDRNDFVL